MKNIQILSLFIFLSFSASAQNFKAFYLTDFPKTPGNNIYINDFKGVLDSVKKNYTHFKSKKVKNIQKKYKELVKNAKNGAEYGDILLKYFAELGNGHTSAFINAYFRNCGASIFENRVFLSVVNDSAFINKGIKAKDEIIKINNIPVMDFVKKQSVYTPASTEIQRLYMTVRYLFSSYKEETRTYTIKTETGEQDITVNFEPEKIVAKNTNVSNNSTQKSNIEPKILNEKTGYIGVTSMMGDAMIKDFADAFDSISKKPYLIIDLRRNQGGNSGNSEKLTEYLIKNEIKACVSNQILKPKPNHYKGKIFVLISPYTFSAAESFALDLLETGNITLIGLPTGGDTGNQPRTYTSKLGYGYRFPSRKTAQISGKGFEMEGKSIMPHHQVGRTVEDYLRNEDTILKYTLNLMVNGK